MDASQNSAQPAVPQRQCRPSAGPVPAQLPCDLSRQTYRAALDIALGNLRGPEDLKTRIGPWGVPQPELLLDLQGEGRPVGRFSIPDKKTFPNIFYWDSAAAVQGFLVSNEPKLRAAALSTVENLMSLQEKLGFIPNASSLPTRSQPPLLSTMVLAVLAAAEKGELGRESARVCSEDWLRRAYQCCAREYSYWTRFTDDRGCFRWFDEAAAAAGTSTAELAELLRTESRSEARLIAAIFKGAGVEMEINETSNPQRIKQELARIWSSWEPESLVELKDFLVSRRLLSASGMDYSASYGLRPMSEGLKSKLEKGGLLSEDLLFSNIGAVVPVDLNCFLFRYGLDCQVLLDKLGAKNSDPALTTLLAEQKDYWRDQAQHFRLIANRVLWNSERGQFCNYDTLNNKAAGSFLHLAEVLYPIWSGLADEKQQALLTAKAETLITANGIAMSLEHTGAQWDYNMWPLQVIMAVQAFERVGRSDLAEKVASGYVRCVEQNYRQKGSIFEKYNPHSGGIDTVGRYAAAPDFTWGCAAYLFTRAYLGEKHKESWL